MVNLTRTIQLALFSATFAGAQALAQTTETATGQKTPDSATLNGKVLNLAITEAVNNLVTGLEHGE